MHKTLILPMVLSALVLAGCEIYIEDNSSWCGQSPDCDWDLFCVFDADCPEGQRCVDAFCRIMDDGAGEEPHRGHPAGPGNGGPADGDEPPAGDDPPPADEPGPGDGQDPVPGDGQCGDGDEDDDLGVCLPHARCVFDNDCSSDAVCVDGGCRRVCSEDVDCGRYERCHDWVCMPRTSHGDECLYSRDCGDGVCVNGTCIDRCSADADCESGEMCDAGLCRPDTRPAPECRSSAECQAGQSCVDARCRWPCVCPEDCATEEICDVGFCLPTYELSPECERSADCDGGTCINGTCE